MTDDHTYTMQMSLNVLQHLGIGLYSNISTVLAEAVANAWDADAEHVKISTDSGKAITIEDDGEGMSVSDANEKYLCIEYARRERGETKTGRHGRPVMGRKGIGKLSLFSIADTVTVHSVKDGQGHGFKMNVKDIENSLRGDVSTYHPVRVEAASDLKAGTRITLTDIRPKTFYPKILGKRLARKFSVIGSKHGFEVTLDGTAITAEDRDYNKKLQYVWLFGENDHSEFSGTMPKTFRLDSKVEVGGTTERVGGWIGTVEKPGQLKDDVSGENLNRIAIVVRGKMAQEDMLGSFEESGAYSKYVMGEIYADFLDRDDMTDIATTGRQLIVEDDPRYKALKEKIWQDIRIIQSKWTEMRTEEGSKAALEIPGIHEWFDNLPQHHKNPARRIFGRINTWALDNDDVKRQLFISGILAFENLKFKDMLDRLDDVDIGNLEVLTELFSQIDDLEANAYYQTTRNRLEIIRMFNDLHDQNTKEKIIQKHLFNHMWLLDPAWERVTASEVMESSMKKALGGVIEGLTDEEKRARLDITYRTTGNKHVIIELKRPEANTNIIGLFAQLKKYEDAASKVLKGFDNEELIEIICVLGKPPKDWENPEERRVIKESLEAFGARIVFYNQLIENAQKAYGDYVEKNKEITRLAALINKISKTDRDAISPS